MRLQLTKLACLFLSLSLLAGCGSTDCSSLALTSVNVSPSDANADHTASPPANTKQFFAFGGALPGCVNTQKTKNATPQSSLRNVTWSVSDPVNVSISNTQDTTFGMATCLNHTTAPVTITATLPAAENKGKTLTGTATLTCN